jgi:hypothetical protein
MTNLRSLGLSQSAGYGWQSERMENFHTEERRNGGFFC